MIDLRELFGDGGRTITLGACVCILVYLGADRFVDSVTAEIKRLGQEDKLVVNRLNNLDLAHRDYVHFKGEASRRWDAQDRRYVEHSSLGHHTQAAQDIAVLKSKVDRLERSVRN